MRISTFSSPAFVVVCTLIACTTRADDARVDFSRDVRPILSQNCFKCHGIDDKARKGKLRLDVRDGALSKDTTSGDAAIAPGKAGESELIKRVFSKDPDEVMPPPAMKVTLTDGQKDVLRRWVEQGADYAPHWAFLAPAQPALPEVKRADWPRNPVDRFVLARLEREGLTPSPEADRQTLARRASIDLVGLPPTVDEVDAFVRDASADAYEHYVDRLLASPRYGERWARRWLDLARYADTNGYEKDRQRSIWPYRDWVINAINADMPFDRFTVEQLAGDLLPNATADQKVATGFHRNTMLNEEGGIDPLEFRFHAVVDRVGTTGTTWMGLTVACAQCHTHKYDPIRHTEYYGLFALLNNADEPEMALPSEDVEAKRREVERQVEALTNALPEKWPAAAPAGVAWSTGGRGQAVGANGTPPVPTEDGSWRFVGENPDRGTYVITLDGGAGPTDRLRLEVLKDGDGGPGRTPHGNFVLSEVTVSVAPTGGPARPVKLARAEADYSQPNYPAADAIDGEPATGWAIDEPGRGPRDRAATFYFDKPVDLPRGGTWTVTLSQQYGERHTIARLRLSLGTPTKVDDRPADVVRREGLDRAFQAWDERESKRAVTWSVARPSRMTSSTPHLTQQDDGSVLAGGDISKSDTYDLAFDDAPAGVTAVRIEALPDPSLPKGGPGLTYYEGPAGDFCLSELTAKSGNADAKFAKGVHSFASGGFTAQSAIDGNPQTGWMVDGGQGRPHVAVFTLAEPTRAKGLALRMLFERHFAPALGRFRVSYTTDPRAGDPAALPPDVAEALAVPAAERSVSQRASVFARFLQDAPELAGPRKEIEQLRRSAPRPTTTLVMKERPAGHGRVTHRYNRGEFLQPEEVVQPGVPAFLPPLPRDQPANRLTFARWLVSRENPLTARVTVNRQWQALFGRGLVRTTEDFGFQGELPSHPDLLDWLAVQFMNDGWSMKRLHRLIVTSSTYRQSSRASSELTARDPQNVLLARGPRFRVEAEVVRDAALRAAGLLSDKLGGPSVFPPQPASVTTEGTYGAFSWNTSTGDDRYRRSLYTFAKRTAPYAMYGTFDAPTGEACLARREVSNTPLQALTLLNDTVFVEAAQAMGRSVAESKEPDDAKATSLLRRVLCRAPAADEVAEVVVFVKRQRERLSNKELEGAKLAGAKDGDVTERAAWTAAARVVLNLDEAVTKE